MTTLAAEPMVIVYQARNRLNGHRYIGFTTKGLEVRKLQHFKLAKRDDPRMHFCRALKKYGVENFDFEVLGDFGDDDDLGRMYEREAIEAYKPEYNVAPGGIGGPMADSTREKISRAAKGRKGTWLGKKFSDEHRKRIGDAQRGISKPSHPHTEETKRRISAANMGHAPTWTGPHSEATKQKLREANKGQVPWILGKNHKEESKKLMSEAKKLAHQNRTPEYTAKLVAAAASMSKNNKKPIVCLTDGREHDSATDAAKFYGMAPNTITAVLTGRRPTAFGKVFRYREVKK